VCEEVCALCRSEGSRPSSEVRGLYDSFIASKIVSTDAMVDGVIGPECVGWLEGKMWRAPHDVPASAPIVYI
jgi:hypothetical protein